MTTDLPNCSTSQNENQQTTDNGADSGSENSLFAELKDIKYMMITQVLYQDIHKIKKILATKSL